MIKVLFWFTCIAYTLMSVKSYRKLDDVPVYILIGVTFPLLLYFCRWSLYIYENPCDDFYLILFYFYSIAIVFHLTNGFGKKNEYVIKEFTMKNHKYIKLVTYLYCVLYLLENYLGSGKFFPAFNKIDIHTYSAPIISYITRSLYPFLLFNMIFLLKTHKKEYAVNVVLLLFTNVVTRTSRIITLISLIQVICFLFYFLVKNKITIDIKINNRLKKVIVFSSIFVVIGMTYMTNYRMNKYGKYNLDYSKEIRYCGPNVFENIIAIYYGYFPFSFNNLNHNMINSTMKHNYIGLYSFMDLYYGVLQFDNLLKIDAYLPSSEAIITTGAATVRTNFYEFYYDFGFFSFIPLLIVFLYLKIINYNRKKTGKNIWDFIYFFYLPLLIFFSFQNLFFAAANYWTILITFVFYKLFIVEENEIKE